MKQSKKHHKIKIGIISNDIFPWDICFALGATEKEVYDFLKQKVNYELNEEEKQRLQWEHTTKKGRTIQLRNGACIIWVKTDAPQIIAHEAFHATDFVLSNAGLRLSDTSDEAYAYFLEHIVKEIYKILVK